MRVTFNTSFRTSVGDITKAAEALVERQREATSGRRIHVASDDPAGALGAVAEHAEMGTVDQFRRTADSATARLSVADTVLSDIVRKIEQASAVLTTAQGSVIGATQRDAIAAEIRSVRDSIYTSMTTQFRGAYIFAGTEATTPPYAKLAGGAISAYAGNTASASLDVDRQEAVQVTFDGSAVMQGSAADDLFTTLENLAAAIETADAAGMAAGSTALNEAFARVTAVQSRVGASLASLDDRRVVLSTARRAADSRRASYEDANMVEALTGLSQAETAYKAALGATSHIGQLSLLDYLT